MGDSSGTGLNRISHPFPQSFSPARFMPHLVKRRAAVRDLGGLPASLGRIGSLEIRLATTKKEIRKAQRLRWRVFFEEGGAIPGALSQLRRRDICPFDRICDHLIVIDHAAMNRFGSFKPKAVGVYRLLRQDIAQTHGGFYSAGEFDIAPLLQRHRGKRFLELGRSCVLPEYRSKRTLELLWRGIWTYVRHHRIDVMFGCASLEGADPSRHSLALSFLHHCAGASAEWAARPIAGRHIRMDMLGAESIDPRKAINALPPLIKGYLRCGARFGDGAVVDHEFGTTDVFVVMPVADIDPRYIEYFTCDEPARLAA